MTADEPVAAAGRTRGGLRVLLVFGLTVLGAWAGWKVAASIDGATLSAAPLASTDELTYRDQSAQNRSALFRLLTRPEGTEPLSLNPVHEPLAEEPAGLPAFPGSGAFHETRYRLAQGAVTDEVSFWRINAEPAAIIRHYRNAAKAKGLVEVSRNPNILEASSKAEPPAAAFSLLFTDPGPKPRVLTVRLTPLDGAQHLTLWLRQASPLP